MRKYLLTIVLNPNLDKTELMDDLNKTLSEVDGKIVSQEELPVKKLAYEVKKTREGNFEVFHLTGSTELPARVSEILRISDPVLRYMLTTDTEVKEATKEVVKEPAKATPKEDKKSSKA
jgi:small subunit ribosomal protein S6